MATSKYITHSVYRIVCFANGKVYVGQAANPEQRRYFHFNKLARNRHANRHMQNAYNYHGKESFYFEILEQCIPPDQIAERELYWVEHFDCYHNGFNATPGGDYDPTYHTTKRAGYMAIWNNIEYISIAECARANGIGFSAMRKRLMNGYTCDADVPPRKDKGKPCIWNGVQYTSAVEAAKAIGVSEKAMWERVRRGTKCDSELGYHQQECDWNGIHYSSIHEAANALGISYVPMWKRLKAGYTCDEDMKRPPKKKINTDY